MPTIRLQAVINRWWERQFFAYPSDLPPARTIDDIHRRIREKGTFDKDDLNGLVSHYTTVDPKGIRNNADAINRLYRRLDAIGEFTNIVPEPNSDQLDDIEHHFQKQEGGHHDVDEWYAPHIIYGSATNHDTTVGAGEREGYINVLRYDNEGRGRTENTGYEIEFADDEGYPLITLQDVPRPRSFK